MGSLDELRTNFFGKTDREQRIDVDFLDEFPDHPYPVEDDEDMALLIDSIRENGVIMPIIVREGENDRYTIISGHRRLYACKKLGLPSIKCRVVDLSDDDAILWMIDTNNTQRSEIKRSVLAKTVRMRHDIIVRRRGEKSEDGERHDTEKILAEDFNLSQTQTRRYLHISRLPDDLLSHLDDGSLSFTVADEISRLPAPAVEKIKTAYDAGKTVPLKTATEWNSNNSSVTEIITDVDNIIRGVKAEPKKSTKKDYWKGLKAACSELLGPQDDKTIYDYMLDLIETEKKCAREAEEGRIPYIADGDDPLPPMPSEEDRYK